MSALRTAFWVIVSIVFACLAFVVVGGITIVGLVLILRDQFRPATYTDSDET